MICMSNTKKAYFAAGCFWGIEAAFREAKGVKNVFVGYMGGGMENPSYEDVCTDETGYAETVEVEFDPSETSYEELLDMFWKIHDPTQLNRQGPDVGTQYRSAIFYVDGTQKKTALESKEKLDKSGKYKEKIATEISKAGKFFKAEKYHQRYYEKHNIRKC